MVCNLASSRIKPLTLFLIHDAATSNKRVMVFVKILLLFPPLADPEKIFRAGHQRLRASFIIQCHLVSQCNRCFMFPLVIAVYISYLPLVYCNRSKTSDASRSFLVENILVLMIVERITRETAWQETLDKYWSLLSPPSGKR